MVAMTIISLPLVVLGLYSVCNVSHCISFNPSSANFLSYSNLFNGKYEFFNAKATLLYLGWFTLQVILHLTLPGKVVKGVPLDTEGHRLEYRMNGLSAMIVSMTLVISAAYFNIISPTFAYDHFLALATTAIISTYIGSIILYIWSRIEVPNTNSKPHYTKLLAPHGCTDNIMYDFFVGRSLNPRCFGVDWKFFCELRPGLIGWALINFSFAAHQYQTFGYLTNSMILVCAFHFYYVLDALMSETAILTTMDITTDGFGLMLAFGDLAWGKIEKTTSEFAEIE